MTGFGKSQKEEFGVRTAKPGSWYNYGIYGGSKSFGRFLKLDDLFAYFNKGLNERIDDTGAQWILTEGEIAVPLQSLTSFFPASEEDAANYIKVRNWHRQYLNEWVLIKLHSMEPIVGRAKQVFEGSIHLLPYISGYKRERVEEGLEKIVVFSSPFTIERLTEQGVDEFVGKH
jgi:hypothetical protein